MRIAIVTETYPPEVNGVARTVGAWVEHLRRAGHEVDLIRPAPRGTTPSATTAELTVRGLPLPRYSALQFGLPAPHRLWQRWHSAPPEKVHIATEGPLGLAALWVAKALHIPVTSSFHTHFHAYLAHYRLGFLAKAALAYLRAFHNATATTLVPTEQLRAQLSQWGFRRLAVAGRGVDTALFHPGQRDPALRAQWGAQPQTPVVLWVSRLAPEKNFELFCQAVAAMRAVRPDLVAVAVGDGPLAAQARANHPEISFAGEQTGQALAAHYASADLFLFPSLTETFGNVVLEALACGLPVLAFDEAAAREFVRTGENGLLVPSGDRATFLHAAKWFAAHPEEIARMGRAAAPSVAAHRWEAVVAQLLDHWRSLLPPATTVGAPS